MRTLPLIEVTRDDDTEFGGVSDRLDYVINTDSLAGWLAAGAKHQSVEARRLLLALELRSLADALEAGTSPFASAVLDAERRARAA